MEDRADEFWEWVQTLTDEQLEALANHWKEEKESEDSDFFL